MTKKHRVYDDRTNETLFTSESGSECAMWTLKNIGESNSDFEHIWVEEVEPNATTDN